MDRRRFLEGSFALALAGLLPDRAPAFGDASRLVFAHARHAGNYRPRPAALRRLSYEIGARTSIATLPGSKELPLDSPELFRHPFLYLAGEGELPPLSRGEVENLRRYLTYGGFLLCDDAAGAGDFERSCERELARVLPGQEPGRVPADHVLYQSFYLLERPVGRLASRPYLTGFLQGERLAVVISSHDLGGAWSRDDLGSWEYEVVPGGESQREKAFRLGVNLVMYAMCTDYKQDQVHVPFIMKRRR
jgi:hypothetical protein